MGSVAQGPSSEIPAPTLILLFGYCAKIKLFKGLGCLRLLWESCVQVGKETWSDHVNVGGVAARGINPV